MKKYLVTLIVAASAVIHAHAADLESQLTGYWQPDMEKTLALANKENREMDPLSQAMRGKMIFEFQKDKMVIHAPPGFKPESQAVPFTVKQADQAANSLTLNADGKEMKVRFDKEQIALNDPKTGWTIFNRMSKEDFDKRKGGAAKIEAEGGDKAVAAGKLEEISAQPIPDKPATGKLGGKEFKVEQATLAQNGILKLRQGSGFFADLEFTIFLFGQKDGFDGKKITVKPNQDSITAHIHMGYMEEGKQLPENEIFMNKYTMKLEFGTAKDGKIPGKIHLRLPDEAGSFVVGTFEAEIK